MLSISLVVKSEGCFFFIFSIIAILAGNSKKRIMKPLLKTIVTLLCAGAGYTALAQTSFPAFPPDSLSKNTHKWQMLEQLGIRLPKLPSTRTDPNRPEGTVPRYPDSLSESPYGWADTEAYDGCAPRNLYFFRTDWGLWTNYREDSVGTYPPIDLLRAEDGTVIQTPEQWWAKRRPELLKHCEEEIWGCQPEAAGQLAISWQCVSREVHDSVCGPSLCKELTGSIDTSLYPAIRHAPLLKARLWMPLAREHSGRMPVMIHIGECRPEFKQAFFEQGWAYMELEHQALQPDNGAFLSDYLIGLLNQGNWRKPGEWGTLRVWAWGVSRLLDYLEEEAGEVDVTRCGLIGFSRLGKTAIVAAVFDPRVSIVYAGCSGCLGVTPVRRHYGEDLEFIPYYWFAGNMMNYCGPLHEGSYLPRKVANLKVDTHAFIALLAPRTLFITAGAEDWWSDSKGAVLSARGATPVYELLGRKGLVMEEDEPRLNALYTEGNIAFHYHEGAHVYSPQSLPAFVELAKRCFAGEGHDSACATCFYCGDR